MLRDSYLLQVHKLPRHGDNFPDIPDDDSSTLLFCLFRLLMKNCNLVKWASWPPTTVKSVCVCVCVCHPLHPRNSVHAHSIIMQEGIMTGAMTMYVTDICA